MSHVFDQRADATGAATGADAGDAAAARERLIAKLLAQRGIAATAPSVPRREPGAVVPLTGAQRGLWFTERIGLDAGAYVMQASIRLAGALDPDALRAATRAVLARHEALRTAIAESEDGEPAQVVADVDALPDVVAVVDVRDAADPGAAAREHALAEVDRPFDLAVAPLVRVTVLRIADDDTALLVCAHHIVCDDSSMGVVLRELGSAYEAALAGGGTGGGTGAGTGLPADAPVQFGDYALWQRRRLDAGEREAQLDHWRRTLAGAPPALDLATDRPRPAERSVEGASHLFTVPAGVTAAVRRLHTDAGCSLYAALLAAFGVLLRRNAGGPGAADDLVVGSPTTDRPLPELDGTVGMFVNSLALRLDLAGDPTPRELLTRARAVSTAALGNADVPFEQVAAATATQRDLARHPLFQVMLVLNRGAATRTWGGLPAADFPVVRATSRFDLTLVVADTDATAAAGADGADGSVDPRAADELAAGIDYSTALFDAATVERLAEQFVAVLTAMAAAPDARLSQLDLTTATDRAAIAALNAAAPDTIGAAATATAADPADPTAATAATTTTVLDLFAEQARRTPDALAVLDLADGGSVTYRELDERSNCAAYTLMGHGVGPEVTVGVALSASVDALVAILGVLKAGGAYVPLDPSNPPRRLAAVLADCGAPVLVAAGSVDGFDGVVLTPADLGGVADTAPPARVAARGLAYVIYTSGSTGTPKGVQVQHDTLANLTRAFVARHGFGEGQRVLVGPPLSFDASVGDVFPALASGTALVFHPEPAAIDGAGLLRLAREHGLTMVDTAAALWRRWVDDLDGLTDAIAGTSLATMMIGGEAAPGATARAWHDLTGGAVALVNHYGPTEATVCATTHSPTADVADAALPIGVPLPGVRAHVLDADLRPVPLGTAGELHLGGLAPARGYRGRPAETAAAFVPDPFTADPGARLYRTGDLARLRADGLLEFLGRVDEQVKIRGNRIEPAEIRAALVAHAGVQDAAVVVREDRHGAPALVAYVVTADGPDGTGGAAGAAAVDDAELRAFCADHVPDYMVPAAFVRLAALPLTPNGKVDVAALPGAGDVPSPRAEHEPPRTPVERTLAEVWREVLGVDSVGRHDNFFVLGGHSLLAAPVLAKVRSLLGVTLPLRALFAAEDLAELATTIEAAAQIEAGAFASQYRTAVPSVDRLRADAVPPPDIEVTGDLVTGPPRVVFLTGGSGFLGAHLLAELLRRTDAEVRCLVRAESVPMGQARLLANLRRAHLDLTDAQLARVVAVPGDMADERLGLDAREFDRLCDETDMIFHNGAVMNFVLTYRWMMPPHVASTVEILRMATRGRTKPVHLMSTLGVYLGKAYDRQVITELDPADDPDGLDTGYHTTKWVADKLGVNAREDRGVPLSVHRIAAIVGDTTTGTAKTDSYLSRQIATCVNVGAVPITNDVIDMVPVDSLAAAIAHCSTGPAGPDYHYYRSDGLAYADLAPILAEAGHHVEVMEYPRWRELMLRATDQAFAPLAYGLPAPGKGRYHPVFDCTRTWDAAAAGGVVFPPADAVMMRRHVDWLESVGAITPSVTA